MKIQPNPYGFNQPVADFQHFVGRRRVMRRVLTSLVYQNSVSIVGMPKVGATSLLWCSLLPEMKAEYGVEAQPFLPVYVDLHALPTANTIQLWEHIVDNLERQAASFENTAGSVLSPAAVSPGALPGVQASEYETFTARLTTLRQRGFKPVVMIDELDYVTVNPNFDLTLFKYMRFLSSSKLASFVTSSHIPRHYIEQGITYTHVDPADDTSSKPVMTIVSLSPFTGPEARQYMENLPEALKQHSQLTRFLLTISGGHPYLLQQGCFLAVEQYHLHGRVDLRRLWHEFNQAAEPLFDQLWQILRRSHYFTTQPEAIQFPEPDLYKLPNEEFELQPAPFFDVSLGGILWGGQRPFSYAFAQYIQRQWRHSGDAAVAGSAGLRNKLFHILASQFSVDELRTLCFELGIEFDGLPGAGKEGKVRELVSLTERKGSLAALIEAGRRTNPQAGWPG